MWLLMNVTSYDDGCTRYSKYVGGISIYWCKAKQSGHLATASDYFPLLLFIIYNIIIIIFY